MKKILLVCDIPGWAYDRKAKALKKLLPEYDFNFCYFDIENNNTISKNYDIVLCFHVGYCNHFLKSGSKIIGCINSHTDAYERNTNVFDLSENVSFIGTVSKKLYDEFKGDIKNITYCPNGVDIDEFKEIKNISLKGKLIIGFVGNDQSKNKGLYDIIIPAIKQIPEIELHTAKKGDFHQKDMINFYNNIDCYICASENEGTPNPCLEAAACGRPLITTRVGNMPELVKDGENSLFIDRNIIDLRKKIEFYKNNRNIMIQHGQKIKQEILTIWTWKRNVQNYRNMFENCLGE